MLVDELLVVGDNGLGDGLTDGVDLRCVSTTSNSDADIDVGELLETDNQEGFVDLESKDFGLDEVEGLSVNFDQALSSLQFTLVLHPLRSSRVVWRDWYRKWMSQPAAFQDRRERLPCNGPQRWRSSSCRSIGLTVLRPYLRLRSQEWFSR